MKSSIDEDEDWRKMTDTNERRRVQNRIAQRNYRRNVKRRLQQLEAFNRGLSVSPSTPKPQEQSPPLPSKDSSRSEKSCLHSIVPTASETLLPELDSINAPQTTRSDTCSFQAVLFRNAQEAEALSGMGEDDETNITPQQKVSDSRTPLADIENEMIFYAGSTVDPTQSMSSPHLNALQKAMVRGRDKIVRLLVESGADVYTVDDYGNNILHLAVRSGHVSLIEFALSHYPNVNDINMAGETPLHIAIEHDYFEVVQMLIRAGADMEFKS